MYESRFRRAWQASLLGAVLAFAQAASAAPIDEVPSGTMLSKDNWGDRQGPDARRDPRVLQARRVRESDPQARGRQPVGRRPEHEGCGGEESRASTTSTTRERSSTRRAASVRRSSPASRFPTSTRTTRRRARRRSGTGSTRCTGRVPSTPSRRSTGSRATGCCAASRPTCTSSTTTARFRSSSSASARTR